MTDRWQDMDWRRAVAELDAAGAPHVLVTVVSVDGSAPREAGAKMVVTSDGFAGSIGGGNLEFQALDIARGLLTADEPAPMLKPFPLGPALGQCCGGNVEILFEPFVGDRMTVFVFGAGHVGCAVVQLLATLDTAIVWVDERAEQFDTPVPEPVTVVADEDPRDVVRRAPAGAYFLVMTHSHDLDEEITAAILKRGDSAYCGLIGSATKAARFRARFKKRGLGAAEIGRLTSPIGVGGIHGKTPAEIAIAVAAQILQVAGGDATAGADRAAICGETEAKRISKVAATKSNRS